VGGAQKDLPAAFRQIYFLRAGERYDMVRREVLVD
jgi:hypothetical protein